MASTAVLTTGCASMGSFGLREPAEAVGLEAQSVTMNVDKPETFHFDFVFDDAAGEGAGASYGSGFIVVTKAGREVQAIAHDFDLPRDAIDGKHWLNFVDLNNDGFDDFTVPRSRASDSAATDMTIMSVFQFDPSSGTFVPVEVLSNVGEVVTTSPGCVQLRFSPDANDSVRESYCYSGAARQWVARVTPLSAKLAASSGPGCEGATPDFVQCRKARLSLDKDLKSQLMDYGKVRRELLARQNGKAYADRFARNNAEAHRVWLQYRDARCNAYVREQGFDSKLFRSAIEACRFDLNLSQMHQYRVRHARARESVRETAPATASVNGG